MKYDDEVAKVSAIQLAKRSKYAHDIDSLIMKYEGSLSRLKRRESELENVKDELQRTKRARDQFRATSNKANAKAEQLKSTLAALRSSRSYRVGKVLGRPLRVVDASKRSVFGLLRPETRINQSLAVADTIAVTSPRAKGDTSIRWGEEEVTADSLHKVAEISQNEIYLDLMADFHLAPSKGTAIKVIYHDYFSCGSLLRTVQFIDNHSSFLSVLDTREKEVIENIRGQARLLENMPFIPPRQCNAGYLVERGRVMYCAHSTGSYNSNGYSTRTAGLTLGLQSLVEDLIVVARPGYPWDSKVESHPRSKVRYEQEINGVTHIYNPGPSWTADRLDQYLAESVDVFVREAQRNRVATIHSASNYVTALPSLIAARRLGIPFVYEVRGLWEITELSAKPGWDTSDRYRLALQLETLVAAESDHILAITEQVRQELIVRGVNSSNVTLLPNCVDTDVFSPMPESPNVRAELGINDQATVIGYAGSLVAYEGVADILAAGRLLHDQGHEIAIVIVGDGPELDRLGHLAKHLGIADIVVFTGRVSSSEIPNYISLFDIMPCPRLQLPVTEMVSPLKPLEAMACGKAVILSDLAPMRDLGGDNGQRALFSHPGKSDSLASSIETLIGDKDLRKSMSIRARLWTVRERTWQLAAVRVLEAHRLAASVYESVEAGSELRDLTIGIISDRFTYEGLRFEANLVGLTPEDWKQQLEDEPIDFLFVESTWKGVDGKWDHKVGFYDDESFQDLRSLVLYCNERKIPTIFWNKEDPVHFNRFRITSKYFDHIFTTDASCIPAYMDNAGSRQKTVASLPFYAQPKLHNILPSIRKYEHNVNYAGSYYGERFGTRSAELSKLLEAANHEGLSIYDRQHLDINSPYKFPDELLKFVSGGLDYHEMVEAYKAHPVHINVNSVVDSPTMFSRRVMEIVASGGAVVSGKGQGVEEIFNSLVPVVRNKSDAKLLMHEWLNNEATRLRDVWLGYRLIHRSHTAGHRLAYVLRTAGLRVKSPEPESYAAFCGEATPDSIAGIMRQTVKPLRIYTLSPIELFQADIPIQQVSNLEEAKENAARIGIRWIGHAEDAGRDRTLFEDLLTATTFGSWSSIASVNKNMDARGLGLSSWEAVPDGSPRLERSMESNDEVLVLRRQSAEISSTPVSVIVASPKASRVLVAGHDLKFAKDIILDLESNGHTVIIDQWLGHSQHDEAFSRHLMQDADVILCEWTLGNAVWYSKNKLPHQRLVTRLHLQELATTYIRNVNFKNVDSIILVGQHMKDLAVRDHGVPAAKAVVIPNVVDTDSLDMPKSDGSQFNIGFVGIIPERKRLDIALDVLARLRAVDERYNLFIKGRRPEDYPWMANRPEEMKYYQRQFERIETDPHLTGAVHFDEYGLDMSTWYQKIGHVLSTSDFESFHLTIADGAASGALPISLAWPGADQIYPASWLASNTDDIVKSISSSNNTGTDLPDRRIYVQEYIKTKFSKQVVLETFHDELFGHSGGNGVSDAAE